MITTKTINLSKFKKELEKRKVKENCKKIFDDLCTWVRENPVMAAAILGGTSWVIKTGQRSIADHSKQRAAEKLIKASNSRIYDHSMGCYIQLKRPLTSMDMENILEIQAETGMRIPAIVRELGLIK